MNRALIYVALAAVALTGLLAAEVVRLHLKLDQAAIQAVLETKQSDIQARDRAIAERDARLEQAQQQIEAERKQVKTAEQARVALPKVLPIPVAPEAISRDHLPQMPSVAIPVADLKPLYDFGSECQECKLKLEAAEKNEQDLQAKIADLETQRDAALKSGKVNFWRRVGRALKATACASAGAGVGSFVSGAKGAAIGAGGGAMVCSIL